MIERFRHKSVLEMRIRCAIFLLIFLGVVQLLAKVGVGRPQTIYPSPPRKRTRNRQVEFAIRHHANMRSWPKASCRLMNTRSTAVGKRKNRDHCSSADCFYIWAFAPCSRSRCCSNREKNHIAIVVRIVQTANPSRARKRSMILMSSRLCRH